MQLSTGDIRLVPSADNATVVILSPFRFKGGLSWDNPFIFLLRTNQQTIQ